MNQDKYKCDRKTLGNRIPNSIENGYRIGSRIDRLLGASLTNEDIAYQQVTLDRGNFIKKYGKKKYEKSLKDILWKSKVKISFDDFCEFLDLRNNFRLYFSAHGVFLIDYSYRNRGFYQRFSQNHNELLKKIIKIYDRPDIAHYQETPRELELLYSAYELMFKDEEVVENSDLLA